MPIPAWRRYLTFWRESVDRDVDDELRFHFEERIADLVARGSSPRDAHAQALAEFGDVERVKADLHDIDRRILDSRGRAEWRNVMKDEIRHALRRLVRQPAFTVPAVVTLALGIAATTAIFTVLDAVVLRPLPFAAAERLVYLDTPMPGLAPDTRWWLARHEMFYFKEHSRLLENIGVYQKGEATVVGDGGAASERVRTTTVSSSLLDVLGFRPFAGRLFVPADNLSEDPQVVVLGYDYWLRRFGGDRGVIGRTIAIEGFPQQIVGVLQAGAHLPDTKVDIWAPAHVDPNMPPRDNHTWFGIGRLKPGATAADLERELAPLVRRFPETFPTVYSEKSMRNTGFRTAVTPLRDWVVGDVVTRALWVLLGSVALVFLVAAANVANLFLVRLDARRREMAMRLALGAGRSHLASHFLAEGLVLALAAAALAVVAAVVGLRALVSLAPDGIPRLAEVHLGWSGVGVAGALAAVTGVIFSLIPIIGARFDVRTLREGSRTLTLSRRRHAVRGTLVTAQVALALVLLAAAGLMVRSFRNLRGVESGFRPAGVLTMGVSLPAARYTTYERTSGFFEQLATRLASMPDVASVGFGQQVPPEMSTGCTGVITEGATREERKNACVVTLQVAPGYFQSLGITVRGRTPTWAETDAKGAGVVITKSLAERFWPGEDAVGKGLRCCFNGKVWYRVVGVTDDVRGNGFDQPPTQAVYFPMIPLDGAPLEGMPRYMQVIVRSRSGNLSALAPAVRRAITELDVQVPIANVRSMGDVVARSMVKRSFTLALLGVASAMALLLSAVGLYGVVSYVVGERRGEIGIRVALGAQRGDVGRMVVMQSVRLTVVGVALGVVGALAATRLLASLLFEVQPNDPLTLATVSLVLVLIAAAASWVPARRAMRVDPVEALRGE